MREDSFTASPRMLKRKSVQNDSTNGDDLHFSSSGESDSESRKCSPNEEDNPNYLSLFEKDYSGPPSIDEVTPILSSDDEGDDSIAIEEPQWKNLFLDRTACEANWREGNYTVSTIKGHSLAIMSVKFVEDTVYSCSLDGTLKTVMLLFPPSKHALIFNL